MKKLLKCATPGLIEVNLDHAKYLLAKARRSIEDDRYAESVRQSCIAMEETLNAMTKKDLDLNDKIKIVTINNPDLRKYRDALHFIRLTRNTLSHASGVDECDVDDAEFALCKMDQFLTCIENSLHNQQLANK